VYHARALAVRHALRASELLQEADRLRQGDVSTNNLLDADVLLTRASFHERASMVLSSALRGVEGTF
jgi:hypothetical protein